MSRSSAPGLAINGRFLHRAVTGVERYALGVLEALDRHLDRASAAEFDVEVLIPMGDAPLPPWRRLRVRRVGRLHGHLWEQFELPMLLRGRALVNLCNLGPLAVRRQLTVIHDVAVFAAPDAFSAGFRNAYRIVLPRLADRSREVATVSEFSRAELARHLGVDPARVTVAPPGVSPHDPHEVDGAALARLGLRPDGYALVVGSRDPRKNLVGVARAAARLPDIPFVAVGGGNAAVFRTNALALPDNVRPLGYVPDPTLRALYRGARLFAFPSLYEGFGIPPLEAMHAGCPVVVSNAASLPEACGDAALYCDPRDPEDIARAIERLWRDEALRTELARRGSARAARFTWDACLARLLPAIRRIAS